VSHRTTARLFGRYSEPTASFDEQAGSWTVTADRWHVGFVDLRGGQGAQVEGRTTAAVLGWLAARAHPWRERIRAVAIDRRTVFKARAIGQPGDVVFAAWS
jgi:hypothetical protein